MTTLYRCRTSLREASQAFQADAPASANWSGEMWPGRAGLIVREADNVRSPCPARWGIPAQAFGMRRDRVRDRTALWFRELFPDHPQLLEPVQRCLIILDSFAYPTGPPGQRVRAWFGNEETPSLAWAGIRAVHAGKEHFCGLLVPPNAVIEPGNAMPALIAPDDLDLWLRGDLIAASALVRRTCPSEAMYREVLEEPWNTAPDEGPPST